MKKMLSLLLALVLLNTVGWAQYARMLDQKELFSTSVCTLGGIAADFVNNPYKSGDSTFAWSNNIQMTIPIPAARGLEYEVLANRAWLELAFTDSGATGGSATTLSVSSNDSVIVFVYAVGPNGGLSNAAIDTLCFVMTTGALDKPQFAEITPWHTLPFMNSATKAYYRALDESALGLGDSLAWHSDRLPYEIILKVVGDCSTTTLVPTTPWCDDYNDTVMFKARMILEATAGGMPGW